METQHNPVVISKDSRNQQLSSKLSYPVNYLHSLEEVKVSLHNSVWSAERELASTVCELRTSRCSSWIYKRQRNHRSSCQHLLDHRKSKQNSREASTSASLTTSKPLTVWITTNSEKFLKRWESRPSDLPPEKPVCRWRSNSKKNSKTWNNILAANWDTSTSRLYVVTLLI